MVVVRALILGLAFTGTWSGVTPPARGDTVEPAPALPALSASPDSTPGPALPLDGQAPPARDWTPPEPVTASAPPWTPQGDHAPVPWSLPDLLPEAPGDLSPAATPLPPPPGHDAEPPSPWPAQVPWEDPGDVEPFPAPAEGDAAAWDDGGLPEPGTHAPMADDTGFPPVPRVLLWAVRSHPGAMEGVLAVTVSLRAVLERLLGDRMVPASEASRALRGFQLGDDLGCPTSVACVAAVGRRAGAAWVIDGQGGVGPEGNLLELRLVDVWSEEEVARVSGPVPRGPEASRKALRELAVLLVAPEQHVGTVRLDGLREGFSLVVDGAALRLEPEDTEATLVLGVGTHNVEVRWDDFVVLQREVEVAFEEQTDLKVPYVAKVRRPSPSQPPAVAVAPSPPDSAPQAAPPPTLKPAAPWWRQAAGLRLPLWVGPLVLTLAVPPAVVAGGYLLDLTYLGPAVLTSPGKCEPLLVMSPSDTLPRHNPRSTPLSACGALWRLAAKGERAVVPSIGLDVLGVAVSGLVGVGVVAVGSALVAAAVAPRLLPGSADSETPAP